MQGEKSLKLMMEQSNIPVRAYCEIHIEASRDVVWEVLTDLNTWPLWKEVETPTTLSGTNWELGTCFQWKRGVFTITAEIVDIESPNRLFWNGRLMGIKAKHYWTLKKSNNGTLVETYEEWEGIIPKLLKGKSHQRLKASLKRDLEGLKRVTERMGKEIEHQDG